MARVRTPPPTVREREITDPRASIMLIADYGIAHSHAGERPISVLREVSDNWTYDRTGRVWEVELDFDDALVWDLDKMRDAPLFGATRMIRGVHRGTDPETGKARRVHAPAPGRALVVHRRHVPGDVAEFVVRYDELAKCEAQHPGVIDVLVDILLAHTAGDREVEIAREITPRWRGLALAHAYLVADSRRRRQELTFLSD